MTLNVFFGKLICIFDKNSTKKVLKYDESYHHNVVRKYEV